MKPHPSAPCVVLLIVFALVASCGNPNEPGLPGPHPPPGPSILRLEITSPDWIEPGQSMQLTANAFKSDGSIEALSALGISWGVSNSAILQVTSAGLATGRIRGEATVHASAGGRNAGLRMFVLPTDTFAIRGEIRDGGVLVENATVTVLTGIGAGLEMLTRDVGRYALYGVAGPVQIEVKKPGYRTVVQQFDVRAHTTHDFTIEAERPRPDYSGAYTLTISSAEGCPLPEEARRRVYTATVVQDGGNLGITLSDADLIVTNGYGNRFSGFAAPDGTITFALGAGDVYYGYIGHFDIVERLGATAFMAAGKVVAAGTPQRVSGRLSGSIMVSSRASAPFLPASSECLSPFHEFDMVRRQVP